MKLSLYISICTTLTKQAKDFTWRDRNRTFKYLQLCHSLECECVNDRQARPRPQVPFLTITGSSLPLCVHTAGTAANHRTAFLWSLHPASEKELSFLMLASEDRGNFLLFLPSFMLWCLFHLIALQASSALQLRAAQISEALLHSHQL